MWRVISRLGCAVLLVTGASIATGELGPSSDLVGLIRFGGRIS